MRWIDAIRLLWGRVKGWRRRPPVVAESAPEPASLRQDAPEPVPNRAERRSFNAERRRLERQRKKFDKFVEPQGPAPRKLTRSATIAPPKTIIEEGTSNEKLVVDVHHSDQKTEVLYEESEMWGEFSFRDTILDQLDRHFVYLKRMKKRDPDSFDLYSRVGASIQPYVSVMRPKRDDDRENKYSRYEKVDDLSPWFHHTRPSFGCIAIAANPEDESREQEDTEKTKTEKGKKWSSWRPKFAYITKYEMPPWVMQQMSGGDTYELTMWFDKPYEKKYKYGAPAHIGFWISRDGKTIKLLKQLDTQKHEIKSRKGEYFSIPERAWRIPKEFIMWAKDHDAEVHTFMAQTFVSMANHIEMASNYSVVRVNVTNKEGLTAVFGIDPRRAAYFFQDRDITLTKFGLKRRIFHIVRPHQRKGGQSVKMHFRGLRDFTWAGYRVQITVPGRDHALISEFDLGAIDSERYESGVKYSNMRELGELMKKEVTGRG
jgi:hypothetical protein